MPYVSKELETSPLSPKIIYNIMVRTLTVHKGSHPVQLTIDEEGLRIEGDLNASTKCTVHTLVFSNPLSLS